MSAKGPNPAGAGPDPVLETAPLLGPNNTSATDSIGEIQDNGTFPSVSKRKSAVDDDDDDDDDDAATDVESGQVEDINGAAASNGDAPKMKADMKTLIPVLAIGIFLVALDQTLTVATYARMGSDLHALNNTSWISTSYFLTLTAFQPLYGRLTAVFGSKHCLLFASLVFGLGCLGCGLSRDIAELCVSRAVAGVGGGGLNAVVTILVTDLVSLRDRGLWQGYINIVYACGVASGGPVGGLLADGVGWRWAFAGQFPVAMFAFVAVCLRLPGMNAGRENGDGGGSSSSSAHWTAKVLRIDFLGAFILQTAVFALLFGLDNGSNEGWGRRATFVPLALTPPLFALFVFVEVKVARDPFAPGHVILDPPLLAAYLSNFCGVAAQVAVYFFIALFFQAAMGLSASMSGLMYVSSSVLGLVGSLAGGYLMRRTGKYYWLTLYGYIILLLGIVPMVLCAGAAVKSTAGVVVGLSILAMGSGISITTTLISVIANAAPTDVPIAIACQYLFRSLGTTIGISASTAVLQQVLRVRLAASLGGDDDAARRIEERVRQSLDYIRQLDPDVARLVRDCYAVAVQWAFLPVAVLGFGALLSAAFMRERKLEGR